MTTGLAIFDQTVQKTNVWLRAVEERLGPCSRQDAYCAWRAVLHALRNQLAPQEVLDFSAQLPLLLRGVFLEGWRLGKRQARARTTEDFIENVAVALPPNFDQPPEHVARAVLETVTDHISIGELRDIIGGLPPSLRQLWPRLLQSV